MKSNGIIKKFVVTMLVFTIIIGMYPSEWIKEMNGIIEVKADDTDVSLYFEEKEDGTYVLIECESKNVTNVVIPKLVNNKWVTSIGSCAFENCSNLVSVEIPDKVTSIGAYAFSGCSSLTDLNIPDGVNVISWSLFENCINLTNITIPDNVTKIEAYAFDGCRNLESINIPNKVTSIGEGAFWNCSNLTTITIPKSVTSIDWSAFGNCTSLTTIYCYLNSYAYQYAIDNDLPVMLLTETEVSLETYTVTFNSNGGTNISSQTITSGQKVKSPITPTRKGYTFAGWHNGTTKYNFSTTVTSNLTLTAKWTQIKVSKISITGNSKKIAAGEKVTLKATATPTNSLNTKVKWSSNNTKYATVNSKGVVTTKKAGKGKTVTIKATALDGSNTKATYKITIMKNAIKKITLKATSKTIQAGKKVTIKAIVSPSKNVNKTLVWSSSNTRYATVNSKGVVTTKKAGKGKTVTIKATATDGSGIKATIKIKIS